jgi:S1-C subfamily serine protease
VRKLLATPFASAVLGGGVAAGVLIGIGGVGRDETRTVFVQSPLAANVQPASVRDGGLTASEIYKRDAPGVAFIRARTLGNETSPFDPYATSSTESTGSGFVLDGEGRILTNAHVVDGATLVSVTLGGDQTRQARIVGKDDSTDLAVLQINPKGMDLHPLSLGSSAGLTVGDPTIAIGNPFGFDRTLTTGVISALQRRIQAPDDYTIDNVIQTDAAINPGNSGGPLIDAAGRVIGINSQIATGANSGGGSVGIGFAVPIDTAKPVMRQLIASGHVERPWIGVEVTPIEPSMTSLHTGADHGLLVQRVVAGSPAASAGILGGAKSVILSTGAELLLGGDVIQSIGGVATNDTAGLQQALAGHNPGDSVDVKVLRAGTPVELSVTLGNRPAGKSDD